MKKLLLLSFLMLLAAVPAARAAEWLTDYGVALRQAEMEGRPLLMLLHRPDLVQKVNFAAEEAADDELLKPYKLCKIDVSTAYGRRVAAAFQATELPLTVIIDRTASVQIYRKTGAFQRDEWKTTLLTYREGVRPVRRVVSQWSGSRAFCST